MATIGELAVNITARTAGFSAGVARVAREANVFGVNLQGIVSTALKFELAIAAAGAAAVAAFSGWGVKLAAEAEMAQAGFEVLLKSADKAKEVLGQIKAFADVTPFEQADLRTAGQTLLAYGVSAENIMPALKMLGDVSLGNVEKLKSLTLAFGQVISKGRLQGTELRQFTEQGFNPLALIAEKAGVSLGEMTAIMEEGGVSAAQVADAFKEATTGAGLFAGAMDKQALTAMGRFSTLKDNIATKAREIGEALLPGIKSGLDMVSTAIQAAAPGFTAVLQTIQEEFAAVFGDLGFGEKLRGAMGMTDIFIAGATAAFQGLIAVAELAAAGILRVTQRQLELAATTERIAKSVLGSRADFGIETFTDQAIPELKALSEALGKAGAEGLKSVSSGEAFKEMMAKIAAAREAMAKPNTGGSIFDTTGLDGAKEKVEKLKTSIAEVQRGVGAVTAGSTAGFSAVQSARREIDRQQYEVQKLALAEQKKANATLLDIKKEVAKPQGPKLAAANI